MSAVKAAAPKKKRIVGELDESNDPSAAASTRFDDIEEILGTMSRRLETYFL